MPRAAIPALTIALAVGLAAAAAAPAAIGGEPEILTPEDAVAIAIERNPALRAADQEVAGASADLRLATSGYLPRLDLTEDWFRSTNPVAVFASKLSQENFGASDFSLDALNSPDPYSNAATRLALRQNVWDAGRTLKGRDAAKLGIAAAQDSVTRTRESVAFGAKRAFWDAVLADDVLKVVRSAEEAAKADADLAARQVEAGLAVPSDQMSADVRFAEVRATRIRGEHGAEVARAALRQALGLSEDRDFTLVPPPADAAIDPSDTAEDRVQEALASRPDLKSLDRRIAQAGIGERIARSHFYPEVGVGAQYEWDSKNLFGNEGNNWTVGASLRVPVFDGTETRARLARAKSDSMRLAAMREAMVEGIRFEVRAAWAERASAGDRLTALESAISQAKEAARIVRERYTEGMAVMVELLGAETAESQARGARAAAARDLEIARAALDLASGRGTVPPQAASQEASR